MIPWDTFKTPQDAYEWAKATDLVLLGYSVYMRTGIFEQWWTRVLELPLVRR